MISHSTLKVLAVTLACILPGPVRAADVGALGDARRTPVVRAVETAGPAVVNVYTETVVDTPFRPRWQSPVEPFWNDFFPDLYRRRSQQRRSLGSGVIVDANGTIVTNEHVIVQASTIRVLMSDSREFTASLVGGDSDFDLAVLKVESDAPLPYVPFADEGDILIGETVISIGNPYGLSHTVTVGVVSAVGRTIQAGEIVYRDFIQTDASINPGNSGGPLLNIEGKLLGINTAIYRQAQGIGFAIPAQRAQHVVDQILSFGSVQPPWIGISAQDLTPDLAFHFGVDPASGVLISGVEPDSPAAGAGLESGQVIQRVDGEPVRSAAAFERRTLGVTAGDRLVLQLLEGGNERVVELEVGALPAARVDGFAWQALGVEVAENGRGPGVLVTRLRRGSPAQEVGMVAGDAITAVAGKDVDGVDAFRRRLAAVRNSNHLLISVLRGRRLYRVTIPLAR